jgi:cytochrome d ubiquinol oxidase subunit II
MSHPALQHYWWIIISLLGSFLAFLLFVQGGQTLVYSLGKSKSEKKIIYNALGRKWELTFTTLVTFGGAFFASFPLFYATSFGGAYWLWMTILFFFIIQAIAYEFRSKPNNFLGEKTYGLFLAFNGFAGSFLIGVVISTFFNGANFITNEMNFSSWTNKWYGLETLANFHNITLGIAVFALSRILAIQYIHNSIENDEINARSKKLLFTNVAVFLTAFLYWLIRLMFINGYEYDPDTMYVTAVPGKYFQNFIEMPLNSVMLVAGIVLVLFGIFRSFFNGSPQAIWYSGAGTVMTVFALFILAAFNNTCFYPSLTDIQNSLNIANASSSHYTLIVMSYVSLFIPFVFAYIIYAWNSINDRKINEKEMESTESHTY